MIDLVDVYAECDVEVKVCNCYRGNLGCGLRNTAKKSVTNQDQ